MSCDTFDINHVLDFFQPTPGGKRADSRDRPGSVRSYHGAGGAKGKSAKTKKVVSTFILFFHTTYQFLCIFALKMAPITLSNIRHPYHGIKDISDDTKWVLKTESRTVSHR